MCTWNQTQFLIQVERFLNLKNVLKLEPKGLEIGRTKLKLTLEVPSNKCKASQPGLKVPFKKNHTK
jgi:hypothetical protein